MENFEYCNPVRVIFGKGQIARLAEWIPSTAKILMTAGGGSIRKNGVYDQVHAALAGRNVLEFFGIEPNPKYETLMKAVELVRTEGIDFLLAVGGGSVLDGTKFIAAAVPFTKDDPWKILSEGAEIHQALPLGCVMTLPATGSEMNNFAVVSRLSTDEKLALSSPKVFPQFSILDPSVTMSLPARQVTNGIVDTFVHICEQYVTYPQNTTVQDRQAEALLLALIEEAPRVLADPENYDARANLVWAATKALDRWLGQGCVQDWATHGIGHEITALTGADHAQTLALVMPALWNHQRRNKAEKLVQYANRVWGITGEDPDTVIDAAIARTVAFFESVGMHATRKAFGVTDEVIAKIVAVFQARGTRLGERGAIGAQEVGEILRSLPRE